MNPQTEILPGVYLGPKPPAPPRPLLNRCLAPCRQVISQNKGFCLKCWEAHLARMAAAETQQPQP